MFVCMCVFDLGEFMQAHDLFLFCAISSDKIAVVFENNTFFIFNYNK